MILTPQSLYSQNRVSNIDIYFRQNSSDVDYLFDKNGASMEQLSTLMEGIASDSNMSLTKIEIIGSSSPEYDVRSNIKLAEERINSLRDYLLDQWAIPDSLLVLKNQGVEWKGLRSAVASSEVEHRDEVLYIIENVPEERWGKISPADRFMSLVDSRNKQLMDLRGGRPYNYLYEDIFPQLRHCLVVVSYKTDLAPMVMIEDLWGDIETPALPQVIFEEPEPIEPEPIEPEPIERERERAPIKFAAKTNLLYDLLITPNIEVEVPIGSRWSIAGEWIFPWWTTSGKEYALQLLSGQVEGRYWFGDRENKPQLTGWFASLYAGGGLYDIRWQSSGYQGEFYIASGVGGGFAHTINRAGSLRMEYSFGFGYLKTNYRYYEGVENNAFFAWQHDGNYRWVGPTKAKVSLVWFIDWQRGGKR